MEIEIRSRLRQILCESAATNFLCECAGDMPVDSDLQSAAGQSMSKFDNFEIDFCPFPEQGWFGTDCAISLHGSVSSTRSGSANGRIPKPVEFANYFASKMLPDFAVKISPLGHINLTPTDIFLYQFLRQLLADESFYSKLQPVVFHKSLLHSSDVVTCELSKVVYRLKRDPSRHDDAGKLFDRWNKSGSRSDALMLVGMLADSELDVSAYYDGLFSSENLPWFFDRVCDQAKTLMQYAPATREGADPEVESHGTEVLMSIGFPLAGSTERESRLLAELVSFRQQMALSIRTRSEIRLMSGLVSLARKFSSLANCPRSRVNGSKEHLRITTLAAPFSRALEAGLALFRFE